MKSIAILCAGASQGLVTGAAEAFRSQLNMEAAGRFGAVGAMKEAFASGEPCDLMILTDTMIHAMAAEGALRAEEITPLGTVQTGVAVPNGQRIPSIHSAAALAECLHSATSVWIPDTVRSTAGIHMRKVFEALGLFTELIPRLREFPNGAAAMRAMAESLESGAIGFTQNSEILFTPGITLVGALPRDFGLSTVYTAAVSTRAREPSLAASAIALLCSPGMEKLRKDCGFE
jgi:molybdate transport system substrate-binding protein